MVQTFNMLLERYKEYANPVDKIKRECDKENIIRLNRGLYESNKNVNPCFLACYINPTSYLSYEWALSYYGLIPERVYTITSASYKLHKTKKYKNYFGVYEYIDISTPVFYDGVTIIEENGYFAKIATKEKAICDSLSKWPVVRSVHDLKELLFEDKRIYIDEFKTCDFSKLIELASKYKKTNLKLLIKWIEKEYMHE